MQMKSPSYRAAKVEVPRVSYLADQVRGKRNLAFEVLDSSLWLAVRGSLVVLCAFRSRLWI